VLPVRYQLHLVPTKRSATVTTARSTAEYPPQWRCVLLLLSLRLRADLLIPLSFDTHDSLLRSLQLLRLLPYLAPVFATKACSLSGADCVEHPLRGIGIGRAVRAVLVEVVDEYVGIPPDIAEVDALATFLEEEQAVEAFE